MLVRDSSKWRMHNKFDVSFCNRNFWTITLIYYYLLICLVYICYILRVYGQTEISVLCFKRDFVCNSVLYALHTVIATV